MNMNFLFILIAFMSVYHATDAQDWNVGDGGLTFRARECAFHGKYWGHGPSRSGKSYSIIYKFNLARPLPTPR